MKNLKIERLRRAKHTRKKIAELGVVRLSVYRSNHHIYAQLIDDKSNRTLVSASSVESEIRDAYKYGNNKAAATIIGKRIAEKATVLGIKNIAFDRSGYKYHGRVKALADAARDNGLIF